MTQIWNYLMATVALQEASNHLQDWGEHFQINSQVRF